MDIPKLKKPNFRRPSRKGGGLDVPKPVTDVYADLKEKRLLPLIGLLLVAIVAVPILLSEGGDAEGTPPPAVASGANPAPASFTVVPATPQLRDYRKRLAHRKRESPFSSYAALRLPNETREEVEKAVDTIESGETVTSTTTTTAPPAPEASAPAEPESGGTAPAQPPASQPPVVKATVSLRAVLKAGYVGDEPKQVIADPQDKLPKPEKAAIVYVGPSQDGKGALFLMSTDVSAYYGSGHCVLGEEFCQELELKTGKSATFAIGYGETRYKITVLGFSPLVEEETVHTGG